MVNFPQGGQEHSIGKKYLFNKNSAGTTGFPQTKQVYRIQKLTQNGSKT